MLKLLAALLLLIPVFFSSAPASADVTTNLLDVRQAPTPADDLSRAYKATNGVVRDSLRVVFYNDGQEGNQALVKLDPSVRSPRLTLVLHF